MTENICPENGIFPGSVLPVTIESALPDVIVCCLKHGTKSYRGILLDMNKGSMPYGVNVASFKGHNWNNQENIVTVEPEQPQESETYKEGVMKTESTGLAEKTQSSALSLRETYNQDPEIEQQNLDKNVSKSITRRLCDKRIRNMRLRPRQVLCSNCKKACGDTKSKKHHQQNNAHSKSSTCTLENGRSSTKLENRKRKIEIIDKNDRQRKMRKTSSAGTDGSPVLKISLGRGDVIEIPRNLPNVALDNTESEKEDPKLTECRQKSHKLLGHRERHRLRLKNKKKSHTKAKSHDFQENVSPPCESFQQDSMDIIAIDGKIPQINLDNEMFDKTQYVGGSDSSSNSDSVSLDDHKPQKPPTQKVSADKSPQSLPLQSIDETDLETGDFKNVLKCVTPEGRVVNIGDIIWGKITGFPWWPGRVINITIRNQQSGYLISQLAHISWFGSATMSVMPCSQIHPFLKDYKLRYNKKKRGSYKNAVKQATTAAKLMEADFGDGEVDVDLESVDE